MIGLGTIANTVAVLGGGQLGMLLKNGIPKRFEKILMQALGLSTVFIGISGVLKHMLVVTDGTLSTQGTMLLIFSLVIGSFLGEWVDIEAGMEKLGIKLKAMARVKNDGRFVEGFNALYPDVTVNITIVPNADFIAKLSPTLSGGQGAPDIFTGESDYVKYLVESGYWADLKGEFGADVSDTWEYVASVGTDSSGVLRALSWQASPGSIMYRRDMALEVLGTDDPAEVQALLDSWEKFNAVAADAKAKGYYMTASDAATYRVFSDNVTAPWVDDAGNLQFDAQVEAWMVQAKEFSDKGYTINTGIWDEPCTAQMFADGKTMCYFGPAWYFNFSMGNAQDPEKGCYGDWAITMGPQAHFWGGTWLMASASSDNPTMLADIMDTFINDEEVCTNLVANEAQFSNNQSVNAKFAADPEYGNDFLGGQNDVAVFVELAKDIKFENKTIYDQIINEQLQSNWREYCQGNVTEDEAMSNFYKAINENYPEVTTP